MWIYLQYQNAHNFKIKISKTNPRAALDDIFIIIGQSNIKNNMPAENEFFWTLNLLC